MKPNGFMDFNAALIKSLKADGYEKVLVQEAATPEAAARIKADVQRDMRNYHLTWAPERKRGRIGIWALKIRHNPACRHPVRDMNYAIKGGAEKAYVFGKCGQCGKLFGPERTRLRDNPASKGQVDETGLRELRLFIENDPALRGRFAAIAKNLDLKIKRGTYDADKAPRLWLYLVDEGARRYAREFASLAEWSSIFNAATRRELASQMARVYGGKIRGGRMANPYKRLEHSSKCFNLRREPSLQELLDEKRCKLCYFRAISEGLGRTRKNPYSRNARFKHIRLRPPAYFDPRSFRTIEVGETGDEITVGCPKGHYDAGRGVCRVGMKAQRILKPK